MAAKYDVLTSLPVTTERLHLRAFQESDRRFEVMVSEHPSLFVNLPIEPRSSTEIEQYVEARLGFESFDEDGQTCALIVESDAGEYVGSMQLTASVVEPLQLQIGWIALPQHHGKGFMTEAVGRVVALAFESVGAHRIVAEIMGGNDASLRLAERVGFRQEAHFAQSAFVKGGWRDEYVYALLASEHVRAAPETSTDPAR
jgi:RimJ/RimL family protein N-acetyltransferase